MPASEEFVRGYVELSLQVGHGPLVRLSQPSTPWMVAKFILTRDVSELFPFVHAVLDESTYHDKPEHIRFMLNGVGCILSGENGTAGCFEDNQQAHQFVQRLITFLNDICRRKAEIQPNFKKHTRISVIEILGLLPGDNCGACGYPTCLAFAAALSRQQERPRQCPVLTRPMQESVVYGVVGRDGTVRKTVTIAVDSEQLERNLQDSQDRIEQLEADLAELTRVDNFLLKDTNDSLPAGLSNREIEVLLLLARGATNTEISNLLRISTHTVKSHVISIFNKLGVDSRAEAAVWAAHHNLV